MARWILPLAEDTEVTGGRVGEIFYNTDQNNVYVYTGTDASSVMALGAGDSLDVDQLPDGTAENQVLITNSSMEPEYHTIQPNNLLGRSASGSAQSTKLQPGMISENSIPHDKLSNIRQGQVLGALPPTGGVAGNTAVEAINIADIVGVTITSGDTAPENPSDNDLWFYQGNHEEGETVEGDNARLYIRQGGTWIDVSPPIYNTNPGPEGPPGQDGAAGRSVGSIFIQDRTASEDIVIQFNDTSGSAISSITIPLDDLEVSAEVESEIFAGQTADGNYTVPVRDAGNTTTKFLREDGDWVAPAGTAYTAGAGLELNNNTFSVVATHASETHIFADTTARNDEDTVAWTQGDIAVITGGDAYIYVGTDLTTGAATVDSDWAELTFTTSTATFTGQTAAGNYTVPVRDAGNTTTKFLREDGDWVTPVGTEYMDFTGASSMMAGTSGLVPAPSINFDNRFLRGDGTWALPSASVNAVANVATNTILGRNDSGSGDSEELTPAEVRTMLNVEDGADVTPSWVPDSDPGYLTSVGTVTVDAVSNVATNTILGRNDSGSGTSEELTPAEVRTMLNVEDGADVTPSWVPDSDPGYLTSVGAVTVDAVSNVATNTILGRNDSGSGTSEELTPAEVRTMLNVEDGADVTPTWVPDSDPGYLTSVGTVTVDVVSNVATNTLLGRTADGEGDSEELSAADVRTLLNVEDGADVTPDWVPATDPGYSTGGGATVSDDAPASPSEGDLWYFTGGDSDVDNNPELFVYVEDGNNTGNWIASAATPQLPTAPDAETSDTTYNLQISSGGDAEWVEADGGGGGGSFVAPTGYTTSISLDDTANGTLEMDSAGLWRFRINNTGNGNRWVVCTSGFDNIVGGWYEFDAQPGYTGTLYNNGMAEWDSDDGGFKIHRWSNGLTSNTTVLNWNDEYSSGTITNQQSMSGATGTNQSSQLIRNTGWVKGEFVISGAVTLVVYTTQTGSSIASSTHIRTSLQKIT